MPAKQPAAKPDTSVDGKGSFWRPLEKRDLISAEARKWQQENTETAKAWAEWVEKNGVPLRPLF